ncbi:MAG TPA: NAD(P)/FAD-dependent oxidoreductase [Aestuariivirgaceae bacterium]|nr:NAD(P)/FAD-dependent oxidoreductase [Aestuariivirgaceae bacterium]
MPSHDALIIGAGHNGLVCGAYLAKAGLKVCALERRGVIGGAAVSEEIWPGYTVSVASFVMTLMQPKIMLDLELKDCGLEVIETAPSFQPFPDGRSIIFWPETSRVCGEIARFSAADAEAYPRYAAHMEGLVPFLRRLLFEVPVDPTTGRGRDLAKTAALAWRFRDLGGRFYDIWDLLTLSAHDYLSRWFESQQMLAALGSYASGSGGNIGPKSPGSAYVLARPFLRDQTTAAGRNGLVRGGMGAISQSIARSGARFGLKTRVDAEVKRVVVENGAAAGVELASGEVLRSDIVIANANPKTTFLRLVAPDQLPAQFVQDIRNFRTASTSFKINLAVEQPPRFTAFDLADPGFVYPGAVVIAPNVDDLERAFDAAKYGRMAEKPYLWMMVPSIFDPTLAPPGKHIVSIFGGHVPYTLRDREWDDDAREDLFAMVMNAISDYAPGIGNSVIHKQVLTPVDLEQMFDLPGGHVHHGDLSIDQIFFKRPARHFADYRSPIARLYQCGASTHPGGGVTGVPGHNAAQVILRDLGKRSPARAAANGARR